MRSLLPAFVGIISGIAAHQTHDVFKRMEDSNNEDVMYWTRQGRYIVGIISALPAYLLFRRNQKDNTPLGDGMLFVSVFASLGIGVQIGYFIGMLSNKGE